MLIAKEAIAQSLRERRTVEVRPATMGDVDQVFEDATVLSDGDTDCMVCSGWLALRSDDGWGLDIYYPPGFKHQ